MEILSDDEVISKLTNDDEPDHCKLIDHIIPASLSRVHPERSESGFGLLGTLPAELLLITLELTDFQSLSRLSRTCLRAKRVVENFVPYQQVLKHAPTVPTALVKADLSGHYPSSAVYHTLRTDRCVSCTDFGGFLHLPTCERVCLECLYQNPGLWMMTIRMAQRYFSLTYKQVQTLRIMRTIPGTYCLRTREKTHSKPFRLVTVKAAKSLAIEVHGSVENLAALFLRPTRQGRRPRRPNYVFERYHKAPLEAPGCDMSALPQQINIGGFDPYAGVSSLRAPCITDTGVDWGQLCRGCQITYKDFYSWHMPYRLHIRLWPPITNMRRGQRLLASTTRLRSRHGMLAHADHCYGALKIVRNLSNEEAVDALEANDTQR